MISGRFRPNSLAVFVFARGLPQLPLAQPLNPPWGSSDRFHVQPLRGNGHSESVGLRACSGTETACAWSGLLRPCRAVELELGLACRKDVASSARKTLRSKDRSPSGALSGLRRHESAQVQYARKIDRR